jgi:uncharacterized iron-regulated protein
MALLCGCHPPAARTTPAPAPAAASPAPAPEEPKPHGSGGAAEPIALPHRIVDQAGQSVEEGKLAGRLGAPRVIYVGEEHPNPHHHAAQLEVLERVYAMDKSLAVGFEMLPRTLQGELDAYVKGELDEAAFIDKIAWKKTWGFSFGLYRPLFAFCRAHQLRAVALNVPRELPRAVAHEGTAALPPDQKAQLPQMQPGPAAHRELVREAFGGHPHGRFADAKFERFYQAQLVWDEGMADKIAQEMRDPQAARRMLVFAGDGHVRRFAIPERAARRGAKPYLIIIPVMEDDLADARTDAVADLYWVLETP